MTTDLDRRIRAALRERAAEVTPQRTELRTETRRTTAQRWAPLLAAAAVAVLAVAVAVAVTVDRGSGSDTGGTGAGGPAYAGYQWRVTSLQDRHGLLDVPPDINATVAFTPNGAVSAFDTLNYLSATYVAGGSSYTVENAGTTYAGYAGDDPNRVRVISAVNKLFFSVSSAVPGGGSVTIEATVQGDTLTLHTTGTEIITVVLDRDGTVSDEPAPSSTTAASVTEAPTTASDLSGSASGTDVPYSGPAGP